GGAARGLERVVRVVQQRVQRAYRQLGQLLQLVEAVDRAQVQRRQGAQGDFAIGVVHAFQRAGGQGDFQAQVGLTHRRHLRVEGAVGVAVVDVLDIDAAG